MNREQATEAAKRLLVIHANEYKQWRKIDDAVRVPTDAELTKRYGIEWGSPNYQRQLQIAQQSFNPSLQLLLDTYSQSLKVDDYFRSVDSGEVAGSQSDAWVHWQRNRLDARQSGLHHAAIKYGVSYASVLPADINPTRVLSSNDRGASIDVFNPKTLITAYGEANQFEEYPILALQITNHGLRLYDEKDVHYFGINNQPTSAEQWLDEYWTHPRNLEYIEKRSHGVGVTPVVRFRDRMMTEGEESLGMVDSLIGMSERMNQTNYQEGMSRHWAAFKQRYVIGWAPKNEMDAFRQSVADTMFFKDDKTKVTVGQFAETDLKQYTDSRQRQEQAFAAMGQLPATILGASAISNVSAEGLTALERSKEAKTSEIQTSLGESHEQVFRLAAHISGDKEAAADFGAEIKWADTSSDTVAQVVDALGKQATMLGVPVEELWADIPGWTQQKVERARKARDEQMLLDPLMGTEFSNTTEAPTRSPEDALEEEF